MEWIIYIGDLSIRESAN